MFICSPGRTDGLHALLRQLPRSRFRPFLQEDVYRLDDQNTARVFAGQRGKNHRQNGIDKKTIHIIKIAEEQ